MFFFTPVAYFSQKMLRASKIERTYKKTDVSINEHNILCRHLYVAIKRKKFRRERKKKICVHIRKIIVKCNKVKINIRAAFCVDVEIIKFPSDDEMTFGAGVRL